MSRYFIFILILFTLACTEDDGIISTTPEIEFVDVSSSTVVAFQESLEITISYLDGDGDLGENDPDTKNLFVTDSRNDVEFQFRVQELAPPGSEISIMGNLKIVLSNIPLIDTNADSEIVIYSIRVQDRAGNGSNTVSTGEITVSKE